MRRHKRLTKRERKLAEHEARIATKMEEGLARKQMVTLDFETSSITGRVSASKPNLRSITRPEARGALERFLKQHPELSEYFSLFAPSTPLVTPYDYAGVEYHTLAHILRNQEMARRILAPTAKKTEPTLEELPIDFSYLFDSSPHQKVLDTCDKIVVDSCRKLLKTSSAPQGWKRR